MNYVLMFKLFFVLSCHVCFSFAQKETRIVAVQSGGSVSLNVNSLNRYQTGMEFNNWTTLRIQVVDSLELISARWNLDVRMSDDEFNGDLFGNTLDPDYLEITVESIGTKTLEPYFIGGDFAIPGSYVPLTGTGNKRILTGIEKNDIPGDYIISISYRLGKGGKQLLGQPPDYYHVDLIFELTRQ